MSEEERETENAVAISESDVPNRVTLNPSTSLDLSAFSEEQRAALLTDYTRGVLDVSRRAHELHVDVATLDKTLQSLAGTAREVAEVGNAVTVTHTQETSVGRTEILMGNTRRARRGKLSKSQAGKRDLTPFYVAGGLTVLLLLGVLFAIR